MVYNMSMFETNLKILKFPGQIRALAVFLGCDSWKMHKIEKFELFMFIGVKWNTKNFSSLEFENTTLYTLPLLQVIQYCEKCT